jgi:hypothetical protein
VKISKTPKIFSYHHPALIFAAVLREHRSCPIQGIKKSACSLQCEEKLLKPNERYILRLPYLPSGISALRFFLRYFQTLKKRGG